MRLIRLYDIRIERFNVYLYLEIHVIFHQCDQDLSRSKSGSKLMEGRPRHPTPRPMVSESEEYDDSYDDSETDPASRTESSIHDRSAYVLSAHHSESSILTVFISIQNGGEAAESARQHN